MLLSSSDTSPKILTYKKMNYKLISQPNEQQWLISQPWCGPIRLSSDLRKKVFCLYSLSNFLEVPIELSHSPRWGLWEESSYVDIQIPPWLVNDGLELCSQADQKERGKHWSLFRCRTSKPTTMSCAALGCIDWGTSAEEILTAPHVCSLGTLSIVTPTSEHSTSLWTLV